MERTCSNINAVVGHQLPSNNIAANIPHTFALAWRDFYTCNWHVVHRARWAWDVVPCALCSLRLHWFSILARNCPVALDFDLDIFWCTNAMTCPPRSPPSGPRSITQSHDLTTSR